MRLVPIGLCALALVACGEPQRDETAADVGCVAQVERSLTWSSAEAPDTVRARAEGPSCAQAVLTLAIRSHNGDPLWAFAASYFDLTAGGVPPEGPPATSAADLQRFLDTWSDLTLLRTSQLPGWPEGATSLSAEPGLSYTTAYSREAYEGVRARDEAALCYAAGVETTQCVVIDPESGAPALLVSYGP